MRDSNNDYSSCRPMRYQKRDRAQQRPKRERLERDKSKTRDEEGRITNPKAQIRRLLIDHENISVEEIQKALSDEGIELSKVAIGNVRTEIREIIKVLTALDLLDREKLDKHRRKRGKPK